MTNKSQADLINDFLTIFDNLLKDTPQHKPEYLIPIYNLLDNESKIQVINHQDALSNTMLTDAASYIKENLALILVDLGFDINAHNINGKSVLINAVNNKLYSLIDVLLEHNVDVNYARIKSYSNGNKVGSSALMFASENGEYEIVKKLVEHGADINYVNDLGQFALIYTIRNTDNHFKCFEHLISQPGIVINRFDKLGNGVLERIIKYGNADFLTLALDKGAYNEKVCFHVRKEIERNGLHTPSFTPISAAKINTAEDALYLLDLVPKFVAAKELKEELSINDKSPSSAKRIKI
jgi:ankyrin repeat protein